MYRFRDLRGVSMYVGRATNLRSRTISYWGSLKGRAHLRRMVPQIGAVEAIECASVHEAAWLERNILERGLLRWNRARGGQEVPVWLVLDPEPRSPSLRLTHAPGTEGITIGPYLGADRARLIRSGILRVWPIAATGTGLSGSERDMAATRGVGPQDRDSFAAAIQDALAGRAAEVDQWRAGLAAARDRASAGLAFELAGQITSEMDAIGWATGVQRVTTLERIDADIHGWSEGVLVSLQIRAGTDGTLEADPGGRGAAPQGRTDPRGVAGLRCGECAACSIPARPIGLSRPGTGPSGRRPARRRWLPRAHPA